MHRFSRLYQLSRKQLISLSVIFRTDQLITAYVAQRAVERRGCVVKRLMEAK